MRGKDAAVSEALGAQLVHGMAVVFQIASWLFASGPPATEL